MAHPPDRKLGIISSLRKLARTGVAILENRIALLTVELEEEKLRMLGLLLWVAGAILAATLAILLVSLTVVFLFPETARVYVLAAFSLVYLTAAWWAFTTLRNRIKNGPPPFQETLAQLRKDRSWLEEEE
jgi:uncharacterized membrane protein YqjE